MASVGKKCSWKYLAPRPYSSLWLWCASHSLIKQQPHDYFLPHASSFLYDDDDDVIVEDEDDYCYSNGDSHGPIDAGYDGDSDGSSDWLDSTLASLDQSDLDLSQCIIKSIPVNASGQTNRLTNTSPTGDLNKPKGKLKNSPVNKRKRVQSDESKSDIQQFNLIEIPGESDQQKEESSEDSGDPSDRKEMKILDIDESHTIVVFKKSVVRNFCFIYGDAKITPLVGSIICDGFKLNPEMSTHISTGFGEYRICVTPFKFQTYPSKDHLFDILDCSGITDSVREDILDYLICRDSSLVESIIFTVEKWRWPSLTALRLFVKPEVQFSHWFKISFSDTKSPVLQWSSLLKRLSEDIERRTRIAKNKLKDSNSINGKTTAGVRIVLVGGVNCGKSSLTRHICNNVISDITDKVFVVDCDPGQSEFSCPGLLNAVRIREPILSPPFVNCLRFNKDIMASCSVAGTGIQNNPDLYSLSVKYLWKTFLSSIPDEDNDKPVIINTIGWTNGIGIHLMVDVLRTFQPTHVIEIKRPPWNGKDNFPFDCNPDTINQINGWLSEPRGDIQQSSSSPNVPCSLQPYLNYDYIRISNQNAPKRCSQENRRNRVNSQLAYFCQIDELLFKNFHELEVSSLDLNNLYFHVQHEFPIDKHLIPQVIKDSWVHLCSIDEINLSLEDSSVQQNECSSTVNQPKESSSSKTELESDKSDSSIQLESVNQDGALFDQQSKPKCSAPPGFTKMDASRAKPFWETEVKVNFKILPFLGENKCLGSAIVKDIDLENNKLIIITPEPPGKFSRINCIVRPQGIFVPEPLQSSTTNIQIN